MNYKNVKIDKTAKIAKQSVIIGDVTIGRDSCVLYYSVIRGDDAPIVIGEETNIQENCTVHVSRDLPVHIGNNVTIGHNAVIHSCTIGDRTLIGMGAIILDGAKIGSDCIIGAGSLVTKNTIIPDGSLVMGSPAKIKRNLTWEEKIGIVENSKEYVSVAEEMWKQGVL
ncbi:gamma carbonic anhydrase family protein [Ruminococcus sp. RTP21358st1_A5_RTP21358_211008]|uniref:gamma carbonic anhydrase family protein n=1 Tax=unclassified Ruminococcus TaxID=2608920 RepID=UPI0034A14D75